MSATSLPFRDLKSYEEGQINGLSGVSSPQPNAGVATAAALVRRIAAEPDTWRPTVEFGSGDDRWYSRLDRDPDHEIWLISWLPGQSTGLHDHGEALGAFLVIEGTLSETTVRPPSRAGGTLRTTRREFSAGSVRGFGYEHIHDVANMGTVPAISLHAYAPELTAMTQYVLENQRLRVASSERAAVDW